MQYVGTTEFPNSAPELQNRADVAGSRSTIDIDRCDAVAVAGVAREPLGELRLGPPFGMHNKDLEAPRWEVFRDVEHVLADTAAGRLANEYDAERTLTTCHIGSTRPRRLIVPLTATITEFGTTYLTNVFTRP